MGTRSLVNIIDDNGNTLVTIYRQFDGYPDGMGLDLRRIIGNAKLCNGFGTGQEVPEWFNGILCFAAYLIGELKGKKIGNVYLMPPGSTDHGEEYVYTIRSKAGKIALSCVDYQGKRQTIPKLPAAEPAITSCDVTGG